MILLSAYLFFIHPVTGIAEVTELSATSTDSMAEKEEAEHRIKEEDELEELKEVKVYEVKWEGQQAVYDYIHTVFKDDADLMILVMLCESGGYPDVISHTNDVGVLQINLAAHWDKIKGSTRAEKVANLQNWRYNIDIGKQIFDASKARTGNGFLPWVCYVKKMY